MKRVLFVCLGNICRSPTAEGVFQRTVDEAGMSDYISIDSCGIGHWHVGKAPDERAQLAAQRRGIDISHLRARQLSINDFLTFDYILAMDHENLIAIQSLTPPESQAHIGLFLDFAGTPDAEVSDPYYGGEEGFEAVLDKIKIASEGLIAALISERR